LLIQNISLHGCPKFQIAINTNSLTKKE